MLESDNQFQNLMFKNTVLKNTVLHASLWLRPGRCSVEMREISRFPHPEKAFYSLTQLRSVERSPT
jgi:hypothetical protein